MMVIPKGRTKSFTGNTVRTRAEIAESGTDVLSSLSEMKGEVRREIEVMNMKNDSARGSKSPQFCLF